MPPAPPAPAGPFPVDPFGSHEDIFPPADGRRAAAPAEAAVPPRPRRLRSQPQPQWPARQPHRRSPTPASLSDVIVTSSHEEVDLADPDVRALLVSLVDDEIRAGQGVPRPGQTLDAILQLTEAEKACTALGLDDTLAEVKALLAELQS